jgi:hypothetical protein
MMGNGLKFDVSMTNQIWAKKVRQDLRSLVCDSLLLDIPESLRLQLALQRSVLRFLAQNPKRLESMIERPDASLPLGKWFERVFLAALQITFPSAQIHHSVPDGLGGELDFIVRDGGSCWHIECAVKFYLRLRSQGSALDSFVGPGGRDRLDLKYAKMRDVQLRRDIPGIQSMDRVIRVLWMSGRILLPIDPNITLRESWPPPLNESAICGLWASFQDFKKMIRDEWVIRVLPRQWWCTSLAGFSQEEVEIFTVFDPDVQSVDPMMVVALTLDQGRVIESLRVLCISDSARHASNSNLNTTNGPSRSV